MVAGRPHHRDGVIHVSIQHPVDSFDDSTGSGAGGPHRQRRDVGVGIEVTTTGFAGSIKPRDVVRIVDLLDHRLGRRRRNFRGDAELRGLNRIENGDDALRTFRVAFGTVPDLLRVGEDRDHVSVRVRKRSSWSGA